MPELHRVRGEALYGGGLLDGPGEALECLRRSLDTASRQGATWFELRAAMSLCRCQPDPVRRDEGRRSLGRTLARFTEGMETPLLRSVRAFLDGASRGSG